MSPRLEIIIIFAIIFGLSFGVAVGSQIPTKTHRDIVTSFGKESTDPSNSKFYLVNVTNPATGRWTVSIWYGSDCPNILRVGTNLTVDTNILGGTWSPQLDSSNCQESGSL